MARGRPHTEEIKAEVMGALLAGMSLSEAARKYSLSKSVVSSIRDNMTTPKLERVRTETNGPERTNDEAVKPRIDDLIAECLMGHLVLQKAIVTICAEGEYIRSQSANDLSRLLEVSTAHSIRLLEAASAGAATDDAGDFEEED